MPSCVHNPPRPPLEKGDFNNHRAMCAIAKAADFAFKSARMGNIRRLEA